MYVCEREMGGGGGRGGWKVKKGCFVTLSISRRSKTRISHLKTTQCRFLL